MRYVGSIQKTAGELSYSSLKKTKKHNGRGGGGGGGGGQRGAGKCNSNVGEGGVKKRNPGVLTLHEKDDM